MDSIDIDIVYLEICYIFPFIQLNWLINLILFFINGIKLGLLIFLFNFLICIFFFAFSAEKKIKRVMNFDGGWILFSKRFTFTIENKCSFNFFGPSYRGALLFFKIYDKYYLKNNKSFIKKFHNICCIFFDYTLKIFFPKIKDSGWLSYRFYP